MPAVEIYLPFFGALRRFATQAQAQAQRSGPPMPNKPQLGSLGERINSNTIAIVSGNLNATYLTIAYDMSAVLDDGDEFRILPVIGKGGGQNIKDVRFLKGVDLGITQSNLLPLFQAAPTRSARSTTRSSTSPSCSMKRCT